MIFFWNHFISYHGFCIWSKVPVYRFGVNALFIIYIYIYIYMCVCVCVCARTRAGASVFINMKPEF